MSNNETIGTSIESPKSIASWTKELSTTGITTTTPYVVNNTEKFNPSLSDIISIINYEESNKIES